MKTTYGLAEQKGLSRTWLVAVMHNDNCLSAEFITGSRNYIPRLMGICHILVTHTSTLEGYVIIVARDNWRNNLAGEDIKKFSEALGASMKEYG